MAHDKYLYDSFIYLVNTYLLNVTLPAHGSVFWNQVTEVDFFFVFSFCSGPYVHVAYGSSQARGRIEGTATSLHLSHSNTESEPYLWPTPQLTPTLGPRPTEEG